MECMTTFGWTYGMDGMGRNTVKAFIGWTTVLVCALAVVCAAAQAPGPLRLKSSNAKVPDNIVTDGLMAYYNFDEGQGEILHDRTGRGNDGTINGAEFVEVKDGFALKFDGIDDFVDCGDTEDLDPAHDITLEAWIWVGKDWSKDFCGVLGKAPWWYGFCMNNAAICSFTLSSGANKVYLNCEFERWYHIVTTYDGAQMTLYVDGTQTQQKLTKCRMIREGPNFYIGRSSEDPKKRWGGYFPGMIDEVRVYNRALTAEEVMRNYGQSMPLVMDVYGGFRTKDGGDPK